MLKNRSINLKVSPEDMKEYAKPSCNKCFGQGTRGSIKGKAILCPCTKKKLKADELLWS